MVFDTKSSGLVFILMPSGALLANQRSSWKDKDIRYILEQNKGDLFV